MKTRVLLGGLALLLVLAACDFGVNVDSFDEAESILQIEATQAEEIFTFTVSISQEDYDAIVADPEADIQEVFLWIKPFFGYDYYSYNPLQRQEVTLDELLAGVSVPVDFAEIANDQNRFWLNAFQLTDDEFSERLEGFTVIASTGFSRGWRDLQVDGQYTYFENSYPTGAFRSDVFDVQLGQGDYDYIVIRQGNPGARSTASIVADGDVFHLVLQMEFDSYISGGGGGGFDEVSQLPEISYASSGGFTTEILNAASLNSALTDANSKTYVWTFAVDSSGSFDQSGGDSSLTPITLDAQPDQPIQIRAFLSSFWDETVEMYAIGPVSTVARTTFDATAADLNMVGGDITAIANFGAPDGNGTGVYTEELTDPFTVFPSAVDADWNIGLPANRYDEADDTNFALSSGDGAADAAYGTLRNDFVELPISNAADNWSGSSDVWVFFDVYHDFSDAWEDRFELQYGGWRIGSNNWDFYNAERLSEWGGFTSSGVDQPANWVRYGNPSVNNGWYQIGFRLGWDGGPPPDDDAPIRFRLRSDNFLDGKQGIAIDNVRVVTR